MSTLNKIVLRQFTSEELIVNAHVIFIHNDTNEQRWLCRDMIGTFSASSDPNRAHLYTEMNREYTAQIVEFARTMPEYSFTLIKVPLH